MALPAAGRCRCGQTEIAISLPPMMTMACHCKGCQRMSASAFSLSAAIPNAGFAVTQGAPTLGGLRGDDIQHFFCPLCMSWMFSRFMPDFVNVRVTLLDDAAWFSPFIETWTSTKLPWASTPAVHSYAQFPPMEEFPNLAAEFARQA